MAHTDPISDMLTRIRNAQMVGIVNCICPYSTLKENILKVLDEEGFIQSYTVEGDKANKGNLSIKLKYDGTSPAIKELKRISKPGLRKYFSVDNMPKVYNGLGLSILSTSKGVIPDYKARELNVGGEILCSVY